MMRQTNPKEHGAALIVTLVMLLIMTLLGLSSMDTTILGERMTGHHKSKQESFEAAEAGLRAGETAALLLKGNEVADGTLGIYTPGKGDPDAWETVSTDNWLSWTGAPLDAVAQQPTYIFEDLGPVYLGGSVELDPENFRHSYRITAQGWGSNSNATSIVQSIFFKKDKLL